MLQNVLVTCGGGFQGLAILEGLRRTSGVRALVADARTENLGSYFACAFRQAPPVADTLAYRNFLQATIAADQIKFIIPATDLDLPLLALERDRFAQAGTTSFVCTPDLLTILFDKRQTYRFFSDAGVHVLHEIELDLQQPAPFPLIAKPLRGFGSKDQYVLSTGALPSIEAPAVAPSTHLWQRFLQEKKEFSVDFAINQRGDISPLAARERIVNFGGFSVLGRTAMDNEPLLIEAGKVARHLASHGGLGGFNIQFIDDGGQPALIDVNARFGTSSSFAIEMGLNLEAWLLGVTTDRVSRKGTLVRYLTQKRIPAEPKNISGVVFDLDDTIIDQKLWIVDKLLGTHAALEGSLPPKSEFMSCALQTLEEGNRSTLLDAVIQKLGIPPALRDELISTYRNFVPADITVYPDVVRVITELRRRGQAIGLLTDNPATSQRQKLDCIEKAVPTKLFDAVVLTDDLGAQKPAPAAYEAIAKRLGVPPDRLAMVGDNLFRDSIGALRAGYAAAFQLRREGTFFNFNSGLSGHVPGTESIEWIETLDDLLWHVHH